MAGSNTTRIAIPAGSIAEALAHISQQSGVSIGYVGRLPPLRLKASQAASARDALDQIAKQAGLHLVMVDARHFRLEQNPLPPAVVPSMPLAVQPADALQQQDIVVTGTKRGRWRLKLDWDLLRQMSLFVVGFNEVSAQKI